MGNQAVQAGHAAVPVPDYPAAQKFRRQGGLLRYVLVRGPRADDADEARRPRNGIRNNAHETGFRVHVRRRKGAVQVVQSFPAQTRGQNILSGGKQAAGYLFNLVRRFSCAVNDFRAPGAFQAAVINVRMGRSGYGAGSDFFLRFFRRKEAFFKLMQNGGDVVHEGSFMLPLEYPSRSRVMCRKPSSRSRRAAVEASCPSQNSLRSFSGNSMRARLSP